jgi:hypothetical protein
MEVALRRRLAGVAEVSISQQQQRAVVTFLPDTRVFSAAEFRAAVAEADVEVISLDARVCGLVDEDGALRPSASGRELLVRLRGEVRSGTSICATGRLDDRAEPYALEIVNSQPRS